MERKPRHPEERLFSLRMIGWSVFQGGLGFALLAAIFPGSSYAGMAEADARALTFFSLVGVIMVLILVNRSFDTSLLHALVRGNVVLRYVLGAVIAIAGIIMMVPALRSLLKFGPLHGPDLAIVAGSAAVLLILLEAGKMIEWRRAAGFARPART